MAPGKIHGGVEWDGVLEPKRGLPREKVDAQLNKKQTVSAAVLLLQPIEIV
jgi:hypothetical protein